MSESNESDNHVDIDEILDSDQDDFEDTIAANAIVSRRKKTKKAKSIMAIF